LEESGTSILLENIDVNDSPPTIIPVFIGAIFL